MSANDAKFRGEVKGNTVTADPIKVTNVKFIKSEQDIDSVEDAFFIYPITRFLLQHDEDKNILDDILSHGVKFNIRYKEKGEKFILFEGNNSCIILKKENNKLKVVVYGTTGILLKSEEFFWDHRAYTNKNTNKNYSYIILVSDLMQLE
jgi:argonaute-like protein implicated in RNA metabolism and viral defense